MTTPIPPTAINAEAPTSRSVFRLLARAVGATNRDADTLRHELLVMWGDEDGTYELVRALQTWDEADPEGIEGVESRLAVWFGCVDEADGRLVAESDPLLEGLSEEFRVRLAGIELPGPT
ncbi:MAG: hypothetical protein AB8G14_07510 [Ilumatobacter sp.]